MSWNIDSAHSEIAFTVRHMMISNVRGHFEELDGVIDLNPERPEDTKVEARIAAASINTREPNRDNHLRSPDFFNAEQYPYMTFNSTRVVVHDETHAKLYGDLTIRDHTHEVILDVEFNGMAKSPWGATSAGFSASTTINRKDWGLNWNQALETGGILVGDEIKINIEVELIKQPETEVEAVAG